MRRNLSIAIIVTAGLAIGAAARPVLAHHAFAAEYDADKAITIRGTITKMEWSNPHAWLHVDVKGPDGTVVPWLIEFGAPNALYRRGWKRSDLPIGGEVTVDGFLSKVSKTTANASNVVTSDGRKLFAGSSGTGAPSDPR